MPLPTAICEMQYNNTASCLTTPNVVLSACVAIFGNTSSTHTCVRQTCKRLHLFVCLCVACADRRSSGCGDTSCVLCQYNPSRICKRNLKNKYLIDDHLKAKCGAGLRVEVVDENGQCISDSLPEVDLEVGHSKPRQWC